MRLGVVVFITSIETQWGHECNVTSFEVCCQLSTWHRTSVHVDMGDDIISVPIGSLKKLSVGCQLSIALQRQLNEFREFLTSILHRICDVAKFGAISKKKSYLVVVV